MPVFTFTASCTFCGSLKTRVSKKQRKVSFDNNLYTFFFCSECLGYSMNPELSPIQLERMYSKNYIESESELNELPGIEHTSRFILLERYLNQHLYKPTDYFLDYGCGAQPETLKLARARNLTPIGMELAKDVREVASANTGEQVLSKEELIDLKVEFSVIFLGDVLEHLTEPQKVLSELASLLKKDGVIISQGPLQGARTLTHALVGMYSCLTPNRNSVYPPYHVTFAHKKSMFKLFAGTRLSVEQLSIEEVPWPAPTFRELCMSFNLRNLSLFLVKKIDILISRVFINYGTRYFMVGKNA